MLDHPGNGSICRLCAYGDRVRWAERRAQNFRLWIALHALTYLIAAEAGSARSCVRMPGASFQWHCQQMQDGHGSVVNLADVDMMRSLGRDRSRVPLA